MELEDHKDLLFLKYYNARKGDYIFTLGLNTAEDTNYIEKLFKQKLHTIKFPTENLVEAYYIYPRSKARGL